MIAPPEAFFAKVRERDREAARKFYKKYLEVKGLSVAAAAEVADEALERTSFLVKDGKVVWNMTDKTTTETHAADVLKVVEGLK